MNTKNLICKPNKVTGKKEHIFLERTDFLERKYKSCEKCGVVLCAAMDTNEKKS